MDDITNRTDIERLVQTFYDRVFADEQIGFIFTLVAYVTPETHFSLMADFWETVLFGQNRYQGNIILKHVELHLKQALEPSHFDHWISLFYQTVDVFVLVLEGQMDITLDEAKDQFGAGDYAVFPVGHIHALHCLQDARILIYK